ncbi:hypothetical protein L1987_03320 [Smallanthus sonchifolius]|uniref:Uncharacterized protein n=1 Tax=Smallanthus sonchifolius TaxID=185202 RepID=A0ACB9KAD7_9ASTR|nr:hypothetical protein L1987_03320 [Smallanthus sonchifolius]
MLDEIINYVQSLQKQVEVWQGIATSIGLTANPIVNFSGVVGTNVDAIGTDVSFDTKTGNFTNVNAGINFSNADLIAALTLLPPCQTQQSRILFAIR